MTVLEQCFPHEICVQVSNDTGVCKCQEHFVVNKDDDRCEEPEPPPGMLLILDRFYYGTKMYFKYCIRKKKFIW